MEKTLKCGVCDFEYTHLVTTIKFYDDDNYNLISVKVDDQYEIKVEKDMKYSYRSQNSISLLFTCEDGHYFYKSFDGHKGNIFIDKNEVMYELCLFLNEKNRESKTLLPDVNYNLLAQIEEFFNESEN